MAGVVGRVDSGWSQTAAAGGYAFRQLAVLGTAEEFEFSKASITRASPLKGTAAFGGAMAWNSSGLEESLDGGVLRGIKGYQARAASAISRRRMLGMAIKTAGLLGEDTALKDSLGRETYADVKRSDLLAARRQVKQHVIAASLHGWVPNRGDDDFMVGE
jgi:tRNA-specific adenosine deaminase 1